MGRNQRVMAKLLMLPCRTRNEIWPAGDGRSYAALRLRHTRRRLKYGKTTAMHIATMPTEFGTSNPATRFTCAGGRASTRRQHATYLPRSEGRRLHLKRWLTGDVGHIEFSYGFRSEGLCVSTMPR